MPAQWFVGDLHFWHEKVAQIRGFDKFTDHDGSIIERTTLIGGYQMCGRLWMRDEEEFINPGKPNWIKKTD